MEELAKSLLSDDMHQHYEDASVAIIACFILKTLLDDCDAKRVIDNDRLNLQTLFEAASQYDDSKLKDSITNVLTTFDEVETDHLFAWLDDLSGANKNDIIQQLNQLGTQKLQSSDEGEQFGEKFFQSLLKSSVVAKHPYLLPVTIICFGIVGVKKGNLEIGGNVDKYLGFI